MEKHTPGPWKVREMARYGEVRGYFVAASDVNGFAYDAEILGEDEYREGLGRWLADARLIAAAPELLAALKAARDTFKVEYLDGRPSSVGYDSEALRPLIVILDAAITKATT